jgi:type VI secretion system protein ImpK
VSENDPFSAFESDRTIIKPRAGRGPKQGAPGAPGAPAASTSPAPAGAALHADGAPLPELPGVAGFNPLLQAATPLLRAAPRLRATAHHPDPAALRASLVEGVRRFEVQARAQGLPNEQVVAGRYVLCTFLDESAAGTPWGGGGAWASHSLLVMFHNEAWGGEKVFQLLGKLAEDVPRHRSLLELLFVVLALGFEGRYRVLDNGRAQLEGVRERLAQMLRSNAPAAEPELSPHWAGVGERDHRLRDGVPVWVVAAATAFALTLVFIALRLSIHDRSDGTFGALQALDVKALPVAAATAPPVPAAPPPPRLARLLQPEIDAGRVAVRDLPDRSVVTLRGDGMFGSGSATVSAAALPLLGRIAQALEQTPGAVLVAGHSDNQPIRSLRYPSNWHLSQERAGAVRAVLLSNVPAERMRAEGRADGEPVADNATPDGRVQNRRVEITLFVPRNADGGTR